MKFSTTGPLKTQQEIIELINFYINEYKEKNFGVYAIILKQTNKLIGLSGYIKKIIEEKEHITIKYRLHIDFWKQGFGIEALNALVYYGFNTLKIKKITLIIRPQNIASIKIAEKAPSL